MSAFIRDTLGIQIRRDDFPDERSFSAIQQIVQRIDEGWSEMVTLIQVLASGTTSNRPATPEDYEQYWDTTIGTLITWDTSNWVDAQGVTV